MGTHNFAFWINRLNYLQLSQNTLLHMSHLNLESIEIVLSM